MGSTKFTQYVLAVRNSLREPRAWARSSRDVCHSRIFTSHNVCRVAYIYTCTRKFLVETSQARKIDYSRKL